MLREIQNPAQLSDGDFGFSFLGLLREQLFRERGESVYGDSCDGDAIQLLFLAWINTGSQGFLRPVARNSRRLQCRGGIDANHEHALLAREAVRHAPMPAAPRRNPEVKATAISQLHDALGGLRLPDRGVRQHVGIFVGMGLLAGRQIPTNPAALTRPPWTASDQKWS